MVIVHGQYEPIVVTRARTAIIIFIDNGCDIDTVKNTFNDMVEQLKYEPQGKTRKIHLFMDPATPRRFMRQAVIEFNRFIYSVYNECMKVTGEPNFKYIFHIGPRDRDLNIVKYLDLTYNEPFCVNRDTHVIFKQPARRTECGTKIYRYLHVLYRSRFTLLGAGRPNEILDVSMEELYKERRFK